MHKFCAPEPFIVREEALCEGRLCPETLLRWAQQVGEQQLCALSAGTDALAKQNMTLLLAQSTVTLSEALVLPGEHIDAQVLFLGQKKCVSCAGCALFCRGATALYGAAVSLCRP